MFLPEEKSVEREICSVFFPLHFFSMVPEEGRYVFFTLAPSPFWPETFARRVPLPSFMPFRISRRFSCLLSYWCSFQVSPFSLRSTISSRSFPRIDPKWGISTTTGLHQRKRKATEAGRLYPRQLCLRGSEPGSVCRWVASDLTTGKATEPFPRDLAGDRWISPQGQTEVESRRGSAGKGRVARKQEVTEIHTSK